MAAKLRRRWLVMSWEAAFDIDAALTYETCETEQEAVFVAPLYAEDAVIIVVEEADLTAPPPPATPERRKHP